MDSSSTWIAWAKSSIYHYNSQGLTTTAASSITDTTATSGGTVISDGGAFITDRGVCWSTSHNPTITDSHTYDSTGKGSFTSSIIGLTPGTIYYIRAYATNSVGTAYGYEVSFTTTGTVPIITVFDYDGNIYNTIKIGTQIWMKQNLKTTHYRNGDAIPNILDATVWSQLTTGAYCNNNNDTNNGNIYGRLYNWYAVADSRNLCPIGWHVSSDTEWTIITASLGGVVIAGGKLKEAGTTHWSSPNMAATNETNFTALPGGYRYSDGTDYPVGYGGDWWCSTYYDTYAWFRYLYFDYSGMNRDYRNKTWGGSVRCVKD